MIKTLKNTKIRALRSFRLGSKLNYLQLADAWKINNAVDVSEIYYRLNGTDYSINAYVPILHEKLAEYKFYVDNTQFLRIRGITIGSKAFVRNYDSKTGTSWSTSGESHYTTNIGATMNFTFIGTSISFSHYADTRGGLWAFSIDGGEAINISVYSDPAVGIKTQLIADNLENTEHNVVATFMGADPANTPSSTARGWVRFGNEIVTATFSGVGEGDSFISEHFIQPDSNAEIALSLRKYDAAYETQWFPYHEQITGEVISKRIKIDGIELTDFTLSPLISCQKIEFIGDYNAFNTNEATEILLNVKPNYTINKYGFTSNVVMKALQKIEVSGYAFMLPVHRDFGTNLTTNLDVDYDLTDADDIIDFITNSDNVQSLKVLSITLDYQIAAFIGRSSKRIGVIDRGDPEVLFIENRNSATIQKIYCYTFNESVLNAGDEFIFTNKYYVGGV